MTYQNVKIGATDLGEVYANLVSCLSNLGNVYSGTAMDRTTLRATSDVGTGASKIAYALDLEAYGHSDVQSGKNLANQGLPLVLDATLGAAGSSGANTQASASDGIAAGYLLHDVVYSLAGVIGTITSNG